MPTRIAPEVVDEGRQARRRIAWRLFLVESRMIGGVYRLIGWSSSGRAPECGGRSQMLVMPSTWAVRVWRTCSFIEASCEAKRRGAAPDFAPLLRSARRWPAGSASQRSVVSCRSIGRRHDHRSRATSEGRRRGSDLAVTAGKLNAGAGVGRLPDFGDLRRSKSVLG